MAYTLHAQIQSQRRGIPEELSDLVVAYGQEHKSTRHCQVFRINKNERKTLQYDEPILYKCYIDKLRRALAVISNTGDIVTVIDHETRHTNSLRHKWGSPVAPNIRLVRCHFDSHIAFQNMHVSSVEVIELPELINTPAAGKVPHIGQITGFRWKMNERRIRHGEAQQIEAELSHNGVSLHSCLFTEGVGGDDSLANNCII